jgi:hypothetical protein
VKTKEVNVQSNNESLLWFVKQITTMSVYSEV